MREKAFLGGSYKIIALDGLRPTPTLLSVTEIRDRVEKVLPKSKVKHAYRLKDGGCIVISERKRRFSLVLLSRKKEPCVMSLDSTKGDPAGLVALGEKVWVAQNQSHVGTVALYTYSKGKLALAKTYLQELPPIKCIDLQKNTLLVQGEYYSKLSKYKIVKDDLEPSGFYLELPSRHHIVSFLRVSGQIVLAVKILNKPDKTFLLILPDDAIQRTIQVEDGGFRIGQEKQAVMHVAVEKNGFYLAPHDSTRFKMVHIEGIELFNVKDLRSLGLTEFTGFVPQGSFPEHIKR